MTIAEAVIKLCDRSNEEFQKSDCTNIPCSTFIMRYLKFEGIVDGTWSSRISSSRKKTPAKFKPAKINHCVIKKWLLFHSCSHISYIEVKRNILIWANKIIFRSLRHKNHQPKGTPYFKAPRMPHFSLTKRFSACADKNRPASAECPCQLQRHCVFHCIYLLVLPAYHPWNVSPIKNNINSDEKYSWLVLTRFEVSWWHHLCDG